MPILAWRLRDCNLLASAPGVVDCTAVPDPEILRLLLLLRSSVWLVRRSLSASVIPHFPTERSAGNNARRGGGFVLLNTPPKMIILADCRHCGTMLVLIEIRPRLFAREIWRSSGMTLSSGRSVR